MVIATIFYAVTYGVLLEATAAFTSEVVRFASESFDTVDIELPQKLLSSFMARM